MMMHWYTTGSDLQEMLRAIMSDALFDPFCLVGGTSLSLRWGHRMSVDIDLFTDAMYGQIDFTRLVEWFGVIMHMWMAVWRSRQDWGAPYLQENQLKAQ